MADVRIWSIGSLTNNAWKLANFAGFYKGIQSAGAAVLCGLDTAHVSYMSRLDSNWALLAGSILIAMLVVLFKMTDHVSLEDDLRFSDETTAEGVGPERRGCERELSNLCMTQSISRW